MICANTIVVECEPMTLCLADEAIEIASTAERIMQIYRDVEKWPEWDDELEKVEWLGPFNQGNQGRLKPKGGPWVNFMLLSVDNHGFTNVSKLPLSNLEFEHTITKNSMGVTVRHRVKISGLLSIFFFAFFNKKIGRGLPLALRKLKAKAEKTHD